MSARKSGQHPIELARDWIDDADFVLVTAGAGLSAAAGFNYSDSELFAREFPGMLQYGFTAQYQLIGFDDWPPELKWGYLAAHVNLVRFSPPKSDIYKVLRQKLEHLDPENIFVMTSNVDAMFERNGFNPERIYTPQGDYSLLQCTTPCWRTAWPWKEQLDQICASIDSSSQRITDSTLIPRCPNCGEEVFLNVRIDGSFIHDHFDAMAEQLHGWLNKARSGQGVVLEIGAGFNTPSVIRWPGERIVQTMPDWRLIRVNAEHTEVPQELGERALSLAGDASSIMTAL